MLDPRNDPNGFTLKWILPISLRAAVSQARLDYWRKVGHEAAILKDGELRRGLDKDGAPMTPISQYTREHRNSATGFADPNAPPLTPAYGMSRTRSLLKWKAYLDRVVFFWEFDTHTQVSWGVILNYHREGKGIPRRDVIGLSRAARDQAKALAGRWLKDKEAGRSEAIPARHGPIGHQRVFVPRPIVQAKPAPEVIKPFVTGWRTMVNGRFVNVDAKHIDLSVAAGVKTP